MNDRDVRAHLSRRLPEFAPAGEPQRLEGGLLNEVWRVPGRAGSEPRSVVVKHAPPHIASQPEVPLDPERIAFEARALHALASGGALAELSTEKLRPPRPLDFDAEAHVLVMEDLGAPSDSEEVLLGCTPPSLGTWLRGASPETAQATGRRLGRFIGRLHARTSGDERLAARFDNRAMQKTRHAVQYEAAGDLCAKAGLADAEALGEKAEALGERFLQPGRCLTMGDLWPPSVLVAGGGLRLIDWELCHYGRPAQDVAHLAAHLWMLAHRAPSETARKAARGAREAFLSAYRAALEAGEAEALLTPGALADCALHFGAEVLVRTVGPFQDGYLYDSLAPGAVPVREATATAAAHLRRPGEQRTFAALRG